MVIYNINQIIYSINQITLGDMNMKNIVGQSQPARHPAANITDISCWYGAHFQFFLCVSVFSDNSPQGAVNGL